MSSVTKTQLTLTQEKKNMLNQLSDYFRSLFSKFSEPQTYGSALEEYIMRHSPQTACDVDRLTRQFEMQEAGRGW